MSTNAKTSKRPAFEDAEPQGLGEVYRRVASDWRLSAVDAELFGVRYQGVFAHHAGQLVGAVPATMGIDGGRLPKYVLAEVERMRKRAFMTEEEVAAAAERDALDDRLLA